MIAYPSGGTCHYLFAGPSNMTLGDSLLVRIESAYQVTFDLATAPLTNLTRTAAPDIKGIAVSGYWQRLTYPDQLVLVAKSTGLSTAFSISYQYIPLGGGGTGDSGDAGEVIKETQLSPLIYIMMGAGGMLGVVLIIALVAWGVVRCWRASRKVRPEENATSIGEYKGSKGKVAPEGTTMVGIEDLETKVPSEENGKKPVRMVMQEATPVNRVLPLVPSGIAKGDKSVKVVNNYEPLATKAGDMSGKLMKSEVPSRGDSLKPKDQPYFDK